MTFVYSICKDLIVVRIICAQTQIDPWNLQPASAMHVGISVMNACEEARHADEENIRRFFFGSLIFLHEHECMPNVELKRNFFPTALFSLMAKIKCLLGFPVPKFWVSLEEHTNISVFGSRFQYITNNIKGCLNVLTFIFLYCHIWLNWVTDHCHTRDIKKLEKKEKKQDQIVVAWRQSVKCSTRNPLI